VRTEYIAADVGLGVGAAALVSAAIWYLARPSEGEKSPEPSAAQGLAVTPSRGGALLGWTGTF
jgi:hypothetical protein